jgi:hypothetical protein
LGPLARPEQRPRPFVLPQRSGAIAEVRVARVAENRADLHVGGRQFQLQCLVSLCVGFEALQIGQRLGDDRLPYRRGSWQRGHRVVNLEDERVGKLTNLAESQLGPCLLPQRHVSLP